MNFYDIITAENVGTTIALSGIYLWCFWKRSDFQRVLFICTKLRQKQSNMLSILCTLVWELDSKNYKSHFVRIHVHERTIKINNFRNYSQGLSSATSTINTLCSTNNKNKNYLFVVFIWELRAQVRPTRGGLQKGREETN